jgi:hypothetical protein
LNSKESIFFDSALININNTDKIVGTLFFKPCLQLGLKDFWQQCLTSANAKSFLLCQMKKLLQRVLLVISEVVVVAVVDDVAKHNLPLSDLRRLNTVFLTGCCK